MYHYIQTLAYQVDPAALNDVKLWRLKVPSRWRNIAGNLARLRRGGKPASPPVVSLNRVVQYLLPDQLVTAHPHAWNEEDRYWLTALDPIDPDLLTRIVAAWLREAFPGKGEKPAEDLDPAELLWEGPVSPGWGADARFLDGSDWFSLLPHAVTTHLARVDRLSWGKQHLELHRVADERQSGEMISWPPLTERGFPWSLRVQFRLATFADLGARLHLHVGVRLWEKELKRSDTGALDLDKGRRTVYLARNGTWLDGRTQVPVFVPVRIEHRWTKGPTGWEGATDWADSLMASVLSDLSLSPLPAVKQVLADLPRTHQQGVAGFVGALVHPPQEKGHRVRPGLSVEDRAALFHTISELLPFLTPAEPSPRHRLGNATRKNRLRKWNEILEAERWDAVVRTVGGKPTVRVFYQVDATRDAITAALQREFGGAVTVEPVQLGELGRPLEVGGRSADALRAAVRQRAEEVAQAVHGGAQGAIVELQWDRQSGSTSRTDPKAAIRLGLARAGMVSQFLQPPSSKEEVSADNPRVTGAVRDLMRQLGVLLDWPRPVLRGDALKGTSLVALATIRQNSGRKGRSPFSKVYIPVMLWMTAEDTRLWVHYPGAATWMPYPEAATHLALADETNWYHNQAALHRWLQDRLLEDVLPNGRTLLMVNGYRTRNWWAWLANKTVAIDDLRFGEKGRMWLPEPSSLWENLRVVRILSGGSGETAQWFGEDRGTVGLSHGLFQLSERTFVSAQEVPGSARKFLKSGRSKLTKPDKQGWLPRLMEVAVLLNGPQEDPAQWAAVAHHLRLMASHHRDALMLPLPLHLAEGLGEYLLPVPGDDDEA